MSSWIQNSAGVATVAAALIAALAALVAARQLRSQAASQKLSSVIATNDLWRLVQSSMANTVTLQIDTVSAIIAAHNKIGSGVASVVERPGLTAEAIESPAPFILGALQTEGLSDMKNAPSGANEYQKILISRGRIIGYTLTYLADLAAKGDQVIADDLRALQKAVEAYVNVLNEVAELYEAGLVDRRLFLGKRHVALIQQAYFVEPYVLWRNSVTPGRWGLRALSVGQEARRYHCIQVLQQSAVRARTSPSQYGVHAGGYQGYVGAVGWMLGAGAVSDKLFRAFVSERHARLGLGKAFWATAKRRQNEAISAMPRTAGSGYAPASNDRWDDFLANPGRLAPDAQLIKDGK